MATRTARAGITIDFPLESGPAACCAASQSTSMPPSLTMVVPVVNFDRSLAR